MLVIVGRSEMHMIMKPYGKLKIKNCPFDFIQNENYHKKWDMQKKPNLGAKKGLMNLQDEFGGGKNVA